MPAVTCDGAVVERTNLLRYLGVHYDRMLTYRQQMEIAALKGKKGLSVPKAMAAIGIEQRHLFHHSVVLSVIDYGLGLTTMSQDKSGKAGHSAKRGNESHTGNHQGHPLRPCGSC